MRTRRLVDVLLASTGLVLFAPLMAVIGGSIRLMDGAPVLFRQTRVSMGGRLFEVLKFRTMNDKRDAEGRLLPDNMRTTALGGFLRRFRLDELPQLWNILTGAMTLIGRVRCCRRLSLKPVNGDDCDVPCGRALRVGRRSTATRC